jgi:hypothetical protein
MTTNKKYKENIKNNIKRKETFFMDVLIKLIYMSACFICCAFKMDATADYYLLMLRSQRLPTLGGYQILKNVSRRQILQEIINGWAKGTTILNGLYDYLLKKGAVKKTEHTSVFEKNRYCSSERMNEGLKSRILDFLNKSILSEENANLFLDCIGESEDPVILMKIDNDNKRVFNFLTTEIKKIHYGGDCD